MSSARVIGVIETLAPTIPAEAPGGDVDLGDTLARFAGKEASGGMPEPIRRRGAPMQRTATITADTGQLVADLEADFQRVMQLQRPF